MLNKIYDPHSKIIIITLSLNSFISKVVNSFAFKIGIGPQTYSLEGLQATEALSNFLPFVNNSLLFRLNQNPFNMKKIFILFAISVLTFTGCTKKGDTGPAGPTGAKGTSNISSYDFNLTASDWLSVNAGKAYNADCVSAAFQTAVLNSGTINVYWMASGTAIALPASIGGIEIFYAIKSNIITIGVSNANGTNPANPGSMSIKVILSQALKVNTVNKTIL